MYELLRVQVEQIHLLTNSVRALEGTLDLKTHAAYRKVLDELGDSEESQVNEKALGVIDLVVAKLRSGQIGSI